jgi:hypothetical protein
VVAHGVGRGVAEGVGDGGQTGRRHPLVDGHAVGGDAEQLVDGRRAGAALGDGLADGALDHVALAPRAPVVGGGVGHPPAVAQLLEVAGADVGERHVAGEGQALGFVDDDVEPGGVSTLLRVPVAHRVLERDLDAADGVDELLEPVEAHLGVVVDRDVEVLGERVDEPPVAVLAVGEGGVDPLRADRIAVGGVDLDPEVAQERDHVDRLRPGVDPDDEDGVGVDRAGVVGGPERLGVLALPGVAADEEVVARPARVERRRGLVLGRLLGALGHGRRRDLDGVDLLEAPPAVPQHAGADHDGDEHHGVHADQGPLERAAAAAGRRVGHRPQGSDGSRAGRSGCRGRPPRTLRGVRSVCAASR